MKKKFTANSTGKFVSKNKFASKKLSLLASSLVVLAAQSSTAMAGFDCCSWSPYVGADVAWRHQGIQRDFGGNQVKKDFPQGDIYAGLKFCDYLGIQAGYEATTSRRKTSNALGNEVVFGSRISPDVPFGLNQVVTNSKIHGWHADLVGFLPFCVCDNQFNLIGSVGVAKLRYKIKLYNTISDNVTLSPNEVSGTVRTFSNSRYVARLGLGLQYMLTECAGLRAMATWENTSRIRKFNPPRENPGSTIQLNLRNATTLGMGVFYNF